MNTKFQKPFSIFTSLLILVQSIVPTLSLAFIPQIATPVLAQSCESVCTPTRECHEICRTCEGEHLEDAGCDGDESRQICDGQECVEDQECQQVCNGPDNKNEPTDQPNNNSTADQDTTNQSGGGSENSSDCQENSQEYGQCGATEGVSEYPPTHEIRITRITNSCSGDRYEKTDLGETGACGSSTTGDVGAGGGNPNSGDDSWVPQTPNTSFASTYCPETGKNEGEEWQECVGPGTSRHIRIENCQYSLVQDGVPNPSCPGFNASNSQIMDENMACPALGNRHQGEEWTVCSDTEDGIAYKYSVGDNCSQVQIGTISASSCHVAVATAPQEAALGGQISQSILQSSSSSENCSNQGSAEFSKCLQNYTLVSGTRTISYDEASQSCTADEKANKIEPYSLQCGYSVIESGDQDKIPVGQGACCNSDQDCENQGLSGQECLVGNGACAGAGKSCVAPPPELASKIKSGQDGCCVQGAAGVCPGDQECYLDNGACRSGVSCGPKRAVVGESGCCNNWQDCKNQGLKSQICIASHEAALSCNTERSCQPTNCAGGQFCQSGPCQDENRCQEYKAQLVAQETQSKVNQFRNECMASMQVGCIVTKGDGTTLKLENEAVKNQLCNSQCSGAACSMTLSCPVPGTGSIGNNRARTSSGLMVGMPVYVGGELVIITAIDGDLIKVRGREDWIPESYANLPDGTFSGLEYNDLITSVQYQQARSITAQSINDINAQAQAAAQRTVNAARVSTSLSCPDYFDPESRDPAFAIGERILKTDSTYECQSDGRWKQLEGTVGQFGTIVGGINSNIYDIANAGGVKVSEKDADKIGVVLQQIGLSPFMDSSQWSDTDKARFNQQLAAKFSALPSSIPIIGGVTYRDIFIKSLEGPLFAPFIFGLENGSNLLLDNSPLGLGPGSVDIEGGAAGLLEALTGFSPDKLIDGVIGSAYSFGQAQKKSGDAHVLDADAIARDKYSDKEFDQLKQSMVDKEIITSVSEIPNKQDLALTQTLLTEYLVSSSGFSNIATPKEWQKTKDRVQDSNSEEYKELVNLAVSHGYFKDSNEAAKKLTPEFIKSNLDAVSKIEDFKKGVYGSADVQVGLEAAANVAEQVITPIAMAGAFEVGGIFLAPLGEAAGVVASPVLEKVAGTEVVQSVANSRVVQKAGEVVSKFFTNPQAESELVDVSSRFTSYIDRRLYQVAGDEVLSQESQALVQAAKIQLEKAIVAREEIRLAEQVVESASKTGSKESVQTAKQELQRMVQAHGDVQLAEQTAKQAVADAYKTGLQESFQSDSNAFIEYLKNALPQSASLSKEELTSIAAKEPKESWSLLQQRFPELRGKSFEEFIDSSATGYSTRVAEEAPRIAKFDIGVPGQEIATLGEARADAELAADRSVKPADEVLDAGGERAILEPPNAALNEGSSIGQALADEGVQSSGVANALAEELTSDVATGTSTDGRNLVQKIWDNLPFGKNKPDLEVPTQAVADAAAGAAERAESASVAGLSDSTHSRLREVAQLRDDLFNKKARLDEINAKIDQSPVGSAERKALEGERKSLATDLKKISEDLKSRAKVVEKEVGEDNTVLEAELKSINTTQESISERMVATNDKIALATVANNHNEVLVWQRALDELTVQLDTGTARIDTLKTLLVEAKGNDISVISSLVQAADEATRALPQERNIIQKATDAIGSIFNRKSSAAVEAEAAAQAKLTELEAKRQGEKSIEQAQARLSQAKAEAEKVRQRIKETESNMKDLDSQHNQSVLNAEQDAKLKADLEEDVAILKTNVETAKAIASIPGDASLKKKTEQHLIAAEKRLADSEALLDELKTKQAKTIQLAKDRDEASRVLQEAKNSLTTHEQQIPELEKQISQLQKKAEEIQSAQDAARIKAVQAEPIQTTTPKSDPKSITQAKVEVQAAQLEYERAIKAQAEAEAKFNQAQDALNAMDEAFFPGSPKIVKSIKAAANNTLGQSADALAVQKEAVSKAKANLDQATEAFNALENPKNPFQKFVDGLTGRFQRKGNAAPQSGTGKVVANAAADLETAQAKIDAINQKISDLTEKIKTKPRSIERTAAGVERTQAYRDLTAAHQELDDATIALNPAKYAKERVNGIQDSFDSLSQMLKENQAEVGALEAKLKNTELALNDPTIRPKVKRAQQQNRLQLLDDIKGYQETIANLENSLNMVKGSLDQAKADYAKTRGPLGRAMDGIMSMFDGSEPGGVEVIKSPKSGNFLTNLIDSFKGKKTEPEFFIQKIEDANGRFEGLKIQALDAEGYLRNVDVEVNVAGQFIYTEGQAKAILSQLADKGVPEQTLADIEKSLRKFKTPGDTEVLAEAKLGDLSSGVKSIGKESKPVIKDDTVAMGRAVYSGKSSAQDSSSLGRFSTVITDGASNLDMKSSDTIAAAIKSDNTRTFAQTVAIQVQLQADQAYLDSRTALEAAQLLRDRLTTLAQGAAQDIKGTGVNSTAIAAFIKDGKLVTASFGDSRVYMVRDGKVRVLEELRSKDNFLGNKGVQPIVKVIDLKPGDKIFIASDGLGGLSKQGKAETVYGDIMLLANTPEEFGAMMQNIIKRGASQDDDIVVAPIFFGKNETSPLNPLLKFFKGLDSSANDYSIHTLSRRQNDVAEEVWIKFSTPQGPFNLRVDGRLAPNKARPGQQVMVYSEQDINTTIAKLETAGVDKNTVNRIKSELSKAIKSEADFTRSFPFVDPNAAPFVKGENVVNIINPTPAVTPLDVSAIGQVTANVRGATSPSTKGTAFFGKSYATIPTSGYQLALKFSELAKISKDNLDQKTFESVISRSDSIKPEGFKVGNKSILATGDKGNVVAEVEPGQYRLDVRTVPTVEFTGVPNEVTVSKNKGALILVGVKPKKIVQKQAGLIQAVYAQEQQSTPQAIPTNDGKLTIQIYSDGNGNGKRDLSEEILPWAGLTITATQTKSTGEIELLSGWNLVGFSSLPEGIVSASGLIKTINSKGGQVTTISALDNGSWKEYVLRGDQSFGQDFKIELGKGFFIKNYKRITWQFDGKSAASGELSLNPGWNLVAIPPIQKGLHADNLFDPDPVQDSLVEWFDSGLWYAILRKHHEIYGENTKLEPYLGYLIWSRKQYSINLNND